MEHISLEKLKNSSEFTENIRWDVTPRIFLEPRVSAGGEAVDTTHGYMLYVDMIHEKPALMIMVLKSMTSKTVGFVLDIPDDLLKESMECIASECISGMYPLGERLEQWLKKEFGLAG